MKVYIAGKLGTKEERKRLEKINDLCKSFNFETFLPHRDIGLAQGFDDVDKIFQGDVIKGFDGSELIIASLDGLSVGAGTAW